mgnify:FL=1|jgi:hypothetical protein|tara:strand:+ start:1882 stop:3255 length:1374 start_codon:yes stop_codon:yes gene_type:complete
MSTFKVRIEDYVGAVGDDTFLGDALTDTAAEVIRAIPDNKIKGFTQESGDITNNSTNIANHRIVSVIRERGTDGEYVECRELPVEYFRKVQDSDSMFSASVESPIYIIKNSYIYVFPTPGASPNAFRVESVIFPTVAASASDITDTPDSFPDSIEDVVVVGASAKACQYLMARVKDSMPSEPVIVLSDITIPSTPANPTISFSNASLGDGVSAAQDAVNEALTNASGTGSTASSASAYTKPAVGGTATELTSVTALDAENVIDDFDGNAIEVDQWFATLSHFIEDEEDSELAASQIAKIKTYIEAFNAEANSARNAMQALIEDARLSTQASIATAGDATQASVANAANDVGAAISKMRESTGAAVAKMSQSTNVNVSNAAKTLEASIQDYSQEVNKFGTDVQRYSAEVSAVINEYSTDVQKYSAQVDRYTKEYTWYQDQYVRLDTKFKESLQVLIAN